MKRMMLIDGADVWGLHATYGFPLELSLPILADRGYIPTWDKLFAAAEADGANPERLLRRVYEIVGDAYDSETATAIRDGFDAGKHKRTPVKIDVAAPTVHLAKP
jgi:alanyl-tRNA synthetase